MASVFGQTTISATRVGAGASSKNDSAKLAIVDFAFTEVSDLIDKTPTSDKGFSEIKNDSDSKIITINEPQKTQEVKDIEKLETHFFKLKCDVLFKKRQFNLSEKFYQQINELFPSENSIKLDLFPN